VRETGTAPVPDALEVLDAPPVLAEEEVLVELELFDEL